MPCSGRRTPGRSGQRADAGAGRTALERAALVLAEAAPDPGVLAGLQRPLETGVDHRAPTADLLRLFDLQQRGAGVPDGEEELGVHVTAGSSVAPVHALSTPSQRSRAGGSIGPVKLCEELH